MKTAAGWQFDTKGAADEMRIRRIGTGGSTARAAMAGVPVLTISSTLETVVAPGDLPDLTPAWRLKITSTEQYSCKLWRRNC